MFRRIRNWFYYRLTLAERFERFLKATRQEGLR
jgi:hypothetical protein